MNNKQNLNNADNQQLNIADVSGWLLLTENLPNKNDYVELKFSNGLTTKRTWNDSLIDEFKLYTALPLFWRACR